VASYWASQGDNLVAGKILGPKALGIYGRAYQLMVMPAALFGEVIDRALFPAMAKIQDDKEKLIKAYLYSLASVAILVLPFSVVIFIVAPEFVAVLLGEKWTAVVLPFQILCVGMFFRASYKMSESLVRALGAVYRRAWRQFVYTFFVLTGAIVGSRWGVSGIAGGTLLAVTITFMLMAHLSLKLLRLSPVDFIKVHFPALRLTFLCGAAGLIIKQMCSAILLSAAVTLIIMLILILTIIYMAIRIKPYFFFGKEGLWLFNTLIERIPDHLNRRIRNILNFSTNISDEYT
jgi:PST family polysaccharide transporter